MRTCPFLVVVGFALLGIASVSSAQEPQHGGGYVQRLIKEQQSTTQTLALEKKRLERLESGRDWNGPFERVKALMADPTGPFVRGEKAPRVADPGGLGMVLGIQTCLHRSRQQWPEKLLYLASDPVVDRALSHIIDRETPGLPEDKRHERLSEARTRMIECALERIEMLVHTPQLCGAIGELVQQRETVDQLEQRMERVEQAMRTADYAGWLRAHASSGDPVIGLLSAIAPEPDVSQASDKDALVFAGGVDEAWSARLIADLKRSTKQSQVSVQSRAPVRLTITDTKAEVSRVQVSVVAAGKNADADAVSLHCGFHFALDPVIGERLKSKTRFEGTGKVVASASVQLGQMPIPRKTIQSTVRWSLTRSFAAKSWRLTIWIDKVEEAQTQVSISGIQFVLEPVGGS